MSREAESDDAGENGQDVGIASTSDPVITTGGHIRELAKVIANPEAVKRLDETRSLQQATLSSDLLVRSEIDDAFNSCDRGIQKLDRQIGELASGELDRVDQLIGRLQGIMLARKRQPPTAGHRLPWQPFNEITPFLSKLTIQSAYGQHEQNTDIVFFEDRPRRTRFRGQNWLCRSAFTSPFSANHPETLARCNKESLEIGTKRQIIDFIRERVDGGLQNIELADRFNRFLVTHENFNKAPDLAAFGEGVRRVFEIGLLCAGVRGGVLLIDEFENAIHTELLMEFTRLVQDLAVELNVQVFLSTHSKEAIDAFVLNGQRTDDVVGFAINRTDDHIKVRRYDGDKLRKLHDAVDFDLRGVR